jgi:hypothetical protein
MIDDTCLNKIIHNILYFVEDTWGSSNRTAVSGQSLVPALKKSVSFEFEGSALKISSWLQNQQFEVGAVRG